MRSVDLKAVKVIYMSNPKAEVEQAIRDADNVRPHVEMPQQLGEAIAREKHAAYEAAREAMRAISVPRDLVCDAVIEVLIHRLLVDGDPQATAARAIAFWRDVAKVFGR